MRLSAHFETLFDSYHAELQDLRHDSEGRDVLQARLKDKRRELNALLPMIEVCPELVAPVFHGAFDFGSRRAAQIESFVSLAEEGFIAWDELAGSMQIAGWAKPLVDRVMKAEGGEAFLSSTVCLEYLLERGASHGDVGPARMEPTGSGGEGLSDDERASQDTPDREFDRFAGSDGDGDDDGRDLDETEADDYLEQQGFDRRTGE